MNLKKYKYIYLIGVGGIGMSALARYFNANGYHVYGYDSTESSLAFLLEKEGVDIHYSASIKNIPENIKHAKHDELLIIYTPAVSLDNLECKYFLDRKFTLYKRAEILGVISKQVFTIAVAGTHGKTTTATMLAHILFQSGKEITAFLGGISKDYKTNLLLSETDDFLIVEADEYDRSFLQLYADIAIITSVDSDHLDIYDDINDLHEAFIQFASQIKDRGCLFIENDIDLDLPCPKYGYLYRYSAKKRTDYYAENINIKSGKTFFDTRLFNVTSGVYSALKKDVEIFLPGEHNVANAIAALAVGSYIGLSINKMADDLSLFQGIERRFDRHIETDKLVYIDDYAHHPNELSATISAVKQLYPGRDLTVIFQPHLFTRTKDFAKDFADALSVAENLFLLDIYPAREKPIVGVDSEMLLELCHNDSKEVCSKDEVLDLLISRKIDVLLTLGAGDINTLVKPIKEMLN